MKFINSILLWLFLSKNVLGQLKKIQCYPMRSAIALSGNISSLEVVDPALGISFKSFNDTILSVSDGIIKDVGKYGIENHRSFIMISNHRELITYYMLDKAFVISGNSVKCGQPIGLAKRSPHRQECVVTLIIKENGEYLSRHNYSRLIWTAL